MRKIFTTLTCLAMLAVLASSAQADLTFSDAGPFDSDAHSFTGTNTTSAALLSTLSFTGDLTEVNTGTFASEARFRVDGTHEYQVSTTTGFTGTLNVSTTNNGVFWAPTTTGSVIVETFESFDDGTDGIADATWENVNFSLGGTVSVVDIGDFAQGTSFVFDTEGSTGITDTELGGFDLVGNLLGNDDDGGTDTLSSLDLGTLAAGDYFIIMGAFNTAYDDFSATTSSTDAGAFNINLNGNSVLSDNLSAGGLATIGFTVTAIPEPASTLALSLFGLCAVSRRRK